jgi:hypothetical protein
VLAHLSEEIERNDIITFHGDDIEDASHGSCICVFVFPLALNHLSEVKKFDREFISFLCLRFSLSSCALKKIIQHLSFSSNIIK